MLCRVYDDKTDRHLGAVRAEPECGKDFCDSCGDCLRCYGGDPCYGFHGDPEAGHEWILYAGKDEREWMVVP